MSRYLVMIEQGERWDDPVRCDRCRHWGRPGDLGDARICQKINTRNETIARVEGDCGEFAELRTDECFGCALFEAKS